MAEHLDPPEKAAASLKRQIDSRIAGSFVAGMILWTSIEIVRFYWFHNLRVWSVRGAFIPVMALGTLAVIISHATLRSALGSQPKISKPIRDEELVRAFATGDAETIRIVRGLATCLYIVSAIYGCIIPMLIASFIA